MLRNSVALLSRLCQYALLAAVPAGASPLFFPPTLSLEFSPSTVVVGGFETTTLTYTLSNPNDFELTNVIFTDTYAAGLVADLNGIDGCHSNTPLFTGSGINVRINTLSGGTQCQESVEFHSTAVGDIVETTSSITSNEASAAGPGTATLDSLPSSETPEPATFSLILLGLGICLAGRRRCQFSEGR